MQCKGISLKVPRLLKIDSDWSRLQITPGNFPYRILISTNRAKTVISKNCILYCLPWKFRKKLQRWCVLSKWHNFRVLVGILISSFDKSSKNCHFKKWCVLTKYEIKILLTHLLRSNLLVFDNNQHSIRLDHPKLY